MLANTGGGVVQGTVAAELAREGCDVAICARHAEEVAEAATALEVHGTTVFGESCDVTDPDQVGSFVAKCAEHLNGIDILVNNAGRAHPGSFATLADGDWQEDLDVKLFSMIRCSREALPHMRARGGGRIVNVNAVYGKYPDPKFFATSTIRAACMSFTKALSMELARDNVLVNCVGIQREERHKSSRSEIFSRIWELAHGRPRDFHLASRATIPYLNEPWYC